MIGDDCNQFNHDIGYGVKQMNGQTKITVCLVAIATENQNEQDSQTYFFQHFFSSLSVLQKQPEK